MAHLIVIPLRSLITEFDLDHTNMAERWVSAHCVSEVNIIRLDYALQSYGADMKYDHLTFDHSVTLTKD